MRKAYWTKIINEKENNDEEKNADEDTDLSDSLLTTHEVLLSINSLQTFFFKSFTYR